jgi:hypothetical protein
MSNFWAMQGSVGWRTPPNIITAAQWVFGGVIDLDPCAGPVGTDFARTSFRLPDNGLLNPWPQPAGSFFLNHPFGTSWQNGADVMSEGHRQDLEKEGKLPDHFYSNWARQTSEMWAGKVLLELTLGWRGIWIAKGDFSTQAHQALLPRSNVCCAPKSRVNYVEPATGQVKKGVNFPSILLGFGVDPDRFKRAYAGLGFCWSFA